MELPYRPNVCMIVLNEKDEVFLGERASQPGVWQLPQGGVEEGISLEDNVRRELHEELGAESSLFHIVTRLAATHRYDFSTVPEYAVGRWRGQQQTFWLVRFLGNDANIHLDRFHPEFMNWRWCPLGEVRNVAEPKRIPGYDAALRETERILQSLS